MRQAFLFLLLFPALILVFSLFQYFFPLSVNVPKNKLQSSYSFSQWKNSSVPIGKKMYKEKEKCCFNNFKYFLNKKNLITNSKYNRPSIKDVPKESNNILCKVKLHVETSTWIATIPCWGFLPSDYIEHKQKHQYTSRAKCINKTRYLAKYIITFWKVMYNHNNNW